LSHFPSGFRVFLTSASDAFDPARQKSMPLPVGARLGPYEIRAPLGAGGMGEVYRARDTRLGRDVAIKIVADHRLDRGDAAARFEREWRMVAALSHPNVVALYDVGSGGDVSYAVMEMLEGESLDRLLMKEALSWRRALEIGASIASGLAAAHDKGIVHRDLKPANVFVTQDGTVKVLDFGLSRPGAAGSVAGVSVETVSLPTATIGTEPGTVMGTVGYMAPEQVQGATADHRSDIFALGCILYEMLTGSRAFKGNSSAETLASILRDHPNDLTDSGRRVPFGIDPIVLRCLEKRPEQRFQSARDLAFALTARLAFSDATTQLIEPAPPPIRWLRPAIVSAVLLAAALGIAWLGGWLRSIIERPRIASVAVLPLSNRSGAPDQDYFADGVTEELITELSKVGRLRVISRTSSMSYKNTRKRLQEIAGELGVDAVVEGSVARDGTRLKVTAVLVDAKSEAQLWQDSFDRDMSDVLSLQSEIAEKVARSVAIELSPDQRSRLQSARRIDPDAFDAYMRGRYYWNKRTKPDLDQAVEAFRRAIDIVPTYAAAYAGLADTYAFLGYQNYLPPSDAFPKARAAATRASELDATLASAYASLGYVNLYYDWDFTSAETNFKHAIANDSQLVTAHHYYSILLTALLRHDEARSEIERAHNLDPLSNAVATDMGFERYYARQYPEAVQSLQDAIAANPSLPSPHFWLGRVYQAQGRFDDALEEFAKGGKGWPPALAGYGHLQGVTGHPDEARKVIDALHALARQQYVSPYGTALVHLGLRDWPQTKLWLSRALDQRTNWAVWLLRDPRWDPLRGDPEFERLVDRVGFPPDAKARAAAGRPSRLP